MIIIFLRKFSLNFLPIDFYRLIPIATTLTKNCVTEVPSLLPCLRRACLPGGAYLLKGVAYLVKEFILDPNKRIWLTCVALS